MQTCIYENQIICQFKEISFQSNREGEFDDERICVNSPQETPPWTLRGAHGKESHLAFSFQYSTQYLLLGICYCIRGPA